eukprot:jgi/Mesen1/1523/ME001323S00372
MPDLAMSESPVPNTAAAATMSPSGNPLPNGDVSSAEVKSGSQELQLLHHPILSSVWTAEEQRILDDNLAKFSDEQQYSSLMRHIKLAALLPEKTVRDVALRCKWLAKNESGKRKREEPVSSKKSSKDKKEKAGEVHKGASTSRPATGLPLLLPPSVPPPNAEALSPDALKGKTKQLLDQNAQVILQIRTNFSAMKVQVLHII